MPETLNTSAWCLRVSLKPSNFNLNQKQAYCIQETKMCSINILPLLPSTPPKATLKAKLTTVKMTHRKTRMLVHRLAMRIQVTTNTDTPARAKLRYSSPSSTWHKGRLAMRIQVTTNTEPGLNYGTVQVMKYFSPSKMNKRSISCATWF